MVSGSAWAGSLGPRTKEDNDVMLSLGALFGAVPIPLVRTNHTLSSNGTGIILRSFDHADNELSDSRRRAQVEADLSKTSLWLIHRLPEAN